MNPNWLPISDAPKDETPVLLWWAYWTPFAPQRAVTGYFEQGAWQPEQNLDFDKGGPTHYMELPQPPEGESQ